MFDDIEFLVAETFKTKSAANPFFETSTVKAPKSCGLIFRIQKSGSTFVIRSVASEDMSKDFDGVNSNPKVLSKLRIEGTDFNEVKFFECDSLEIAQTIQKQMSNRRFPIYEEHVCNVSDPGFSWWLKDEGHSISILFSLSHTDQMSDLVKLGPLGDCSLAHRKFQKIYGFFNTLFPVKSFSCGRSRFNVSVDIGVRGYFDHLKQAFIHGEFSLNLASYIEDIENSLNPSQRIEFQSAHFFLKELIIARSFWLKVQGLLEQDSF